MKSPQQHDAMPLAVCVAESTDKTPPNSATRYVRSDGGHKYPIVLLSGFWILSVMVGWLSISDLISPGAEPQLPLETIVQKKSPVQVQERSPGQQLVQTITVRTPPSGQDSPLGVLGAIASGCIILSLLLSRKIRQR